MFMNKLDLINALKNQVDELPIRAAYIFGSFAKGTYTSESDIDLLVVSDTLSKITAKAAFMPLGRTLGRKIDVLALSLVDFEAINRDEDEFWCLLLKHAITLKVCSERL